MVTNLADTSALHSEHAEAKERRRIRLSPTSGEVDDAEEPTRVINRSEICSIFVEYLCLEH